MKSALGGPRFFPREMKESSDTGSRVVCVLALAVSDTTVPMCPEPVADQGFALESISARAVHVTNESALKPQPSRQYDFGTRARLTPGGIAG